MALRRTVWFRYTLFSICTFPNLHGFRSAQISICTDFDLQSRTFSSLHGFRSAQFSLCNFWICKDFALLSIRSAQISICTDFDLHVFRYANQFQIYGFFDLQIKFRSTDFSICKSNFDLQIFRSANQVLIYRFFDLQIKYRSIDFSICKSNFTINQVKFNIHTMPVNIHIYLKCQIPK